MKDCRDSSGRDDETPCSIFRPPLIPLLVRAVSQKILNIALSFPPLPRAIMCCLLILAHYTYYNIRALLSAVLHG